MERERASWLGWLVSLGAVVALCGLLLSMPGQAFATHTTATADLGGPSQTYLTGAGESFPYIGGDVSVSVTVTTAGDGEVRFGVVCDSPWNAGSQTTYGYNVNGGKAVGGPYTLTFTASNLSGASGKDCKIYGGWSTSQGYTGTVTYPTHDPDPTPTPTPTPTPPPSPPPLSCDPSCTVELSDYDRERVDLAIFGNAMGFGFMVLCLALLVGSSMRR